MSVRYEYLQKPKQCHACKEKNIADIIYGLPDYSVIEPELKAVRIALGGCCITGDDPPWKCTSCGVLIYRKAKKSIKILRDIAVSIQ